MRRSKETNKKIKFCINCFFVVVENFFYWVNHCLTSYIHNLLERPNRAWSYCGCIQMQRSQQQKRTQC